MAAFDTSLSPRFGTYIASYLMGRGIEPKPIFDAAAVDYQEGVECTRALRPVEVARLIEEVADITEDTHAGLNIGLNLNFRFAGLNAMIMISSENLDHALQSRIRYDSFINNAIQDRVDRSQSEVRHKFFITTTEKIELRHLNELIVGQMVNVLRSGTLRHLSPSSITFANSIPEDVSYLVAALGTEDLTFGAQANALIFDSQVTRVPFLSANKSLYTLITDSLSKLASGEDSSSFSDAVYRSIIRVFDQAQPTWDLVASDLCVTERTLRRRLKDEGTTFKEIKQVAMMRKASQLLTSTDLPIIDIAERLGYSEASAFTRAFKLWTGVTPHVHRSESA